MHASSLQFGDMSLARADVSAQVTTTQSKGERLPKADVKLSAANLSASSVSFKTISASFSGTQSVHTLQVTSKGSPLAIDARLDGHLDKSGTHWNGELVSAALKTDRGTWSTADKPKLAFNINAAQASLSPHCWTSNSQSLEVCLKEELHAGKRGSLTLDVKHADFSLIKDLLPPDLDVKGRTDATATVSWTEPSPEHAVAHVEVAGRGISVTAETNGSRQTLHFKETKLSADFKPQSAQIQSTVSLNDGGELKADIAVADPLTKRQLSGSVTVDDVQLAQFNPVLASLSPQLSASGTLSAELQPRGTLQNPRYTAISNLTPLPRKVRPYRWT